MYRSRSSGYVGSSGTYAPPAFHTPSSPIRSETSLEDALASGAPPAHCPPACTVAAPPDTSDPAAHTLPQPSTPPAALSDRKRRLKMLLRQEHHRRTVLQHVP